MSDTLRDYLTRNREAISNDWIEKLVSTYPADSAGFLTKKKDQFHNPIGHAIREELPAIVDQILGNMDPAEIGPSLDKLIRIRSVQDFSPANALQFVFDLKDIIRAWMKKGDMHWGRDADDLFDDIDRVALFAFDIYSSCKEQMHEIRLREIKMQSARLFEQVNRPRKKDGER